MPVLNEYSHNHFASAIDAEGFVHVDLELELGVEVAALGDLSKDTFYPTEWTKSKSCKVATATPEKPAVVMEHPLPSPSPPRSPSASDQPITIHQPSSQTSNSSPEKHPAANQQPQNSPQQQSSPEHQKQQSSNQSSPGSQQQTESNGRQASPNSRSSICHVRAAELFPKKPLEADEPNLSVPFNTICGEAVHYLSRTQDGLLAMSNYRIYHKCGQSAATILPLMLVESADVKDIFYLHVMCKDARSIRCTFTTGDQCVEWQRRIESALQPPASLEGLFAFCFRAWAAEPEGGEVTRRLAAPLPTDPHKDFRREVSRLQFDINGAWRVSSVNSEFKLCASYPPLLLVPACVSDEALETVAKFRSSRRIPAVVWRHRINGAVIARCSQPEVGWLGWRSNEDEQLLAALAAACHFDRGLTTTTSREPAKKVLIVDARSYASAVTNRARGGGCECPQYYPCAEIQFMCLPNIHSVRKSAQALRSLAAEPADHANWHSVLEKSLWLQSVGGLLKAANLVTRAIHIAARPTLVHCSDGWDRTPQIVSLAQLLLDPYYRTIDGFRVLVEREWLDFGHKFADRCGHTVGTEDLNERCPVFLQWLDCVHQVQVQYPCSFEFSQAYLIKLAQHTYSCLFGTFLCNSRRERQAQRVAERTFSVWRFLNTPDYRNHLYEPNGDEVLFPAHSPRALVVWSAVYLGAAPDTPAPQPQLQHHHNDATHHDDAQDDQDTQVSGVMTKTRSYGDLLALSEPGNNTVRRSSDPSITVDPMKMSTLSISANGEGSVGVVNNNGNADQQQQLDDYSDESGDSDIMSGSQINGRLTESQTNFVQMHNLINNTDSGLINTTITKQIVNGYSKVNGNVPILNNGISSDSDVLSNSVDSNSNTKTEDIEVDLINSKIVSGSVYENGNTSLLIEDRLLIDSPDQIDGITESSDYVEQAIDTIADSSPQNYEERPARIVTSGIVYKSGAVQMGLTPSDEMPVFIDGNSSDSLDINVRVRNESLTWRSISECSQQTDSSSGCIDLGAELNTSGASPGTENPISKRRQRLDSVQNGGLNDSAAILLETEIGNLLSAEAKRLSEQQQQSPTTYPQNGHSVVHHRRQRSEGGSTNTNASSTTSGSSTNRDTCPPHCGVCNGGGEEQLACSEMTLCPNSPLRAFRTYSAGATSMSKWHGRSGSVPTTSNHHSHQQQQQLPSMLDSCRVCCCSCCGSHATTSNGTGCRRPQRVSNGSMSNRTDRWGSVLDPVDGLVCPQSPVQHRLQQIIKDHLVREELLMRELHAARVELLQRACRTSRMTPDHPENNSEDGSEVLDMSKACEWTDTQFTLEEAYFDLKFRRQHPFGRSAAHWDFQQPSEPIMDLGPLSGECSSQHSRGTSSTSGGGGSIGNGSTRESGVLWVPDHAVSRCTRCQTHFWLGKRKHHCRNCGKIFCAECSENTTPLPNEQLFSPVRVCADCFATIVTSQQGDERSPSREASTSSVSIAQAIERRRIPSSSPIVGGTVSSSHSSPSSDIRHLNEPCKQQAAAGEQKLTTNSQVTTASN